MPYPELGTQLKELIEDHKRNNATPLLLAVYFRSEQYPSEDCVFEVLKNFGYGQVADDNRIFQMTFGRSDDFEIPVGARVRLFLTSPVELNSARRQDWPDFRDIYDAMGRGDFEILYQADDDEGALNAILSSRMAKAS